MLKYTDWEQLLEFHWSGKKHPIDRATEKLKKDLQKDFGDLVTISNFDSFVREGEPVQHRVLFSTKDFHSMNVNFTEEGKLYSIDFWKPDKVKPVLTMYVKHGSIDKIAKIIPAVLRDPKPMTMKEIQPLLTEGELNEDENEEVRVEFKSPPSPELIPKGETEYEYGDPKIIFNDLKKYVQMVIDGEPSLVITGTPGVGKTFLVTKQLKEAGVDYVHIKGRSTAAGLYIALYENKDKILVIDDCDSVFRNEEAVNILKSALDSYEVREISWLVGRPISAPSGQKIPTKFVFNGGVIFISNLPQKKIDYAIKSRSFVVEVALSPEDMIARMQEELPKVHEEVPFAIRKAAMNLIESVYKSAEHLELSMRTLVKSIKILENVDDLTTAKRLILQQCSYR